MDELDWTVIETLVPKCDLCKLLVDLRSHWQSDKADEQMSYEGDLQANVRERELVAAIGPSSYNVHSIC
jgi:hypothetical protein